MGGKGFSEGGTEEHQEDLQMIQGWHPTAWGKAFIIANLGKVTTRPNSARISASNFNPFNHPGHIHASDQ